MHYRFVVSVYVVYYIVLASERSVLLCEMYHRPLGQFKAGKGWGEKEIYTKLGGLVDKRKEGGWRR